MKTPNNRTTTDLLRSIALVGTAGLASMLGLIGCGGLGKDDPETRDLHGRVLRSDATPLAGATVYLVPASDVDGRPLDGADVLSGRAEVLDEPLEDLVRRNGPSYTHAVADAAGQYRINAIPAGRYFVISMPPAGDSEHLPGGAGCRAARDADTFSVAEPLDLVLSSSPSPAATYVGASRCIGCHPSYMTTAGMAHRVGLRTPGVDGALQDRTAFPGFDDGLSYFKPATTHAGGTTVWLSDLDQSPGSQAFKTRLSDPTSMGETVFLKAYLWFDTNTDHYSITLENVIGSGDPPRTYIVDLTYGGAVFTQRYLVRVPGRQGRYQMLQFQHGGNDSRADFTRRVFADCGLLEFFNPTTNKLQDPPPTQTVEGNCFACHSTGYTTSFNQATGEWLCDAVDDPNGAFDIDDDGSRDEINNGCENCHGPGSEHVAEPMSQRFIVRPQLLSPSREMMICGRCHGSTLGAGSVANGQPLDGSNSMMRPGQSRQTFLAQFVTRKGPSNQEYWTDLQHSYDHHQQYDEMVRSRMHRNKRELATCTSCHGAHGGSLFRRALKADPDDAESALCAACHSIDPLVHMQEKTGSTHAGLQTRCIDCHMPATSKAGAGRTGLLLGPPTGGSGDADLVYYHNDVTCHLFGGMASKNHPDVRGKQPTKAMPVPYTNSCGTCHDASSLPHLDGPDSGK